MKRGIAAAALLLLAACSHQRYDQDSGSREYSNRPNTYTAAPAKAGNTPDPANAPLLALIGVAALGMNPTYYEKSSLGGKCVVRVSETDPLGAPCNNIVVILEDEQGKELSRRPCSADGQFSFSVERGKKYRIGVSSERYSLPASDRGPFVQGQELLLTLKPAAR